MDERAETDCEQTIESHQGRLADELARFRWLIERCRTSLHASPPPASRMRELAAEFDDRIQAVDADICAMTRRIRVVRTEASAGLDASNVVPMATRRGIRRGRARG